MQDAFQAVGAMLAPLLRLQDCAINAKFGEESSGDGRPIHGFVESAGIKLGPLGAEVLASLTQL